MKLLLIAPPAAGKGTQAQLLSDFYQIPHLSLGELLRAEVKQHTAVGLQINEAMQKGELISDEIAWQVLAQHLNSAEGFILDGFPRNMAQVMIMERAEVSLDAVVFYDVSYEELKARISNRLSCPSCGKVYLASDTQKCSECMIDLVKRSDDNEATFQNRLSVYQTETEPVVDYYRKKGLLVTIDGSNNPHQIFNETTKVLDDKK